MGIRARRHSPLKIGDLVQWTINGVDQFPELEPVRELCRTETTSSSTAVRPAFRSNRSRSSGRRGLRLPTSMKRTSRRSRRSCSGPSGTSSGSGRGRTTSRNGTSPPIDPATGIEIDQTDPKNWLSFHQARREPSSTGTASASPSARRVTASASSGSISTSASTTGATSATKPASWSPASTPIPSGTPSGKGLRILIWGTSPALAAGPRNGPGSRSTSRHATSP